jgi:hypothetical protein
MLSTGSTKVATALGTFALLLFLFAQPMAATPSQPRIRVLILDGFSNHDWHQTTALLRGILEASGLFTVLVSTAPSTTASPGWEQWRPNFSDYDVVIQTCNDIGGGPSWPREVQIAFENYVRNGGGAAPESRRCFCEPCSGWLGCPVTVAIPTDFPTEAATSIRPEIQIPASAQ